MEKISPALIKAFISLLHPRMLFLMIWPVLLALVLWIGLAVIFGTQAFTWVGAQVRAAPGIESILTLWPFTLIAAHYFSWIALALFFVPLVLVTAVLIIGIFAMPTMVNHVAERDYPSLDRRKGGSFFGAVWNSIAALLLLVGIAMMTLPLWLLPLLWPILPVLLFAYLSQRVFRYDALAEHASEAEMSLIINRNRGQLFALGILISVVSHVPLLGFFAPVFAGLVFIHYCLDWLNDLRTGPLEGVAVRL